MWKIGLIVIMFIISAKSTFIDKKQNDLNSSKVNNYAITKESYVNQDIQINYPQINNLNDINKQKKINELIKDDAFKTLNNFKDGNRKLSIEINYDIKYNSSNLISIQYLGYIYVEKAAHPSNMFFITNININMGSKIKLKELININDDFVEKFKHGKYKTWDSNLNLESEGVLNYVLEDYTNQELIEYFNTVEPYFFFTKDSIGISIEVAHAIGDHVEFEMKYIDITDNIKNENEVWVDFTNH